MQQDVLQELLMAVKCFGRTAHGSTGSHMHDVECGVLEHTLVKAKGKVDFHNKRDKWVLLFHKGEMMLCYNLKEDEFLPWLEKQLEIQKGKRAAKAAEKKVNKKVEPPPSKRPMRAAKANALQELSKTRKAAPGNTPTKRVAVAKTTKESAAAAAAAAGEEEDDDAESESEENEDEHDAYSWITDKIVKAYKDGTDHDKISVGQQTMYLTRWRAKIHVLGVSFLAMG